MSNMWTNTVTKTINCLDKAFTTSSSNGNYNFNRPSDKTLYIRFMKKLIDGPRRTAEAMVSSGLIAAECFWTEYRVYCSLISSLSAAGLIEFKNRKCQLTEDGRKYLQINAEKQLITLPKTTLNSVVENEEVPTEEVEDGGCEEIIAWDVAAKRITAINKKCEVNFIIEGKTIIAGKQNVIDACETIRTLDPKKFSQYHLTVVYASLKIAELTIGEEGYVTRICTLNPFTCRQEYHICYPSAADIEQMLEITKKIDNYINIVKTNQLSYKINIQ